MGCLDVIVIIDNKISNWIETHTNEVRWSGLVSFFGSIYFTVGISVISAYLGIFYGVLNLYKLGIYSSIGLILSTIMVLALKLIFKRERTKRPTDPIISRIDPYSFPSGHLSRIGVMVVTTLPLPALPVIYIIITIITAFHRIKKGYHFFSDCIAGFIIGFLTGVIVVINGDIIDRGLLEFIYNLSNSRFIFF